MKQSLLFLLVLVLTASGCSDEPVQPTPETNPTVEWQRLTLPGSKTDDRVMALSATDEDLFVLGQRYFATVHGEASDPDIQTHYFAADGELPFVSRNYFIYPLDLSSAFGHNSMSINLNCPGAIPVSVQLPLVLLDPSLSARARYSSGDSYAHISVVNDDGLMLAPVFDDIIDAPGKWFLYLIQVRPPDDAGLMSATLERKIEWPYWSPDVMVVGNRFFASNVKGTYEVYEDGTIVKLFEHDALSMIEHNNRLFLSSSYGLYASANDGAAWEFVVYTGRGTLFVVDDQLCLLRGNMFRVIDVGSGKIEELASDGLPMISAPHGTVAQFDDRVYIGTDEGLYYKKTDEFFNPRSQD